MINKKPFHAGGLMLLVALLLSQVLVHSGKAEDRVPTVRSGEPVTRTAANSVQAIKRKVSGNNKPLLKGKRVWQTPRFLLQGACSPRFLKAVGERVTVVAHRWGVGVTSHDLLFTSADRGETWSNKFRLNNPIQDFVFDEKGNQAFLTGVASVKYARSYSRLQWQTRSNKGAMGKMKTIWSFTGKQLIEEGSCAVRVDEGSWVFATQGHLKTFKGANGPDAVMPTRDKILVAVDRNVAGPKAPSDHFACPQPVASIESINAMGLAPWATDLYHAGFLTNRNQWQELVHFTTNDGGLSWSSMLIPFNIAPNSTTSLEEVIPMIIKRDGKRLAVTLECTFKDAKNESGYASQTFLLTSRDLGKTWSEPGPLTKLIGGWENGAYVTDLYLKGEFIYVAKVRRDQGNNLDPHSGSSYSSSTAWLTVSSDFGGTWFKHRVLDSLGKKSTNVRLAGAADAVHLALYNEPNPIYSSFGRNGKKVTHEAEQYLVVRSFSTGSWRAPETLVPKNFKEEAVPEPVQEEF